MRANSGTTWASNTSLEVAVDQDGDEDGPAACEHDHDPDTPPIPHLPLLAALVCMTKSKPSILPGRPPPAQPCATTAMRPGRLSHKTTNATRTADDACPRYRQALA